MTSKIDRVLRVVLVLALVLSVVPAAQAQMPAVKAKVGSAKSQPVTAAKSARGMADGTQEGIKLHGHWTIVVRDPDGKEVTRREFENALTADGQTLLVKFLTKQGGVNDWAISLVDTNLGECGALQEVGSQRTYVAGASKTITLQLLAKEDTAMLRGNTLAGMDCTINRVTTYYYDNTSIFSQGFKTFTTKLLPSPAPAVAGQYLDVTVTFTFQ